MPTPPGPASRGNLGAGLDTLLAGFGVVRSQTRDQVSEVVEAELRERHHAAEIVQLRYGVLTLSARPVAAELLGYDRDNLLKSLEAKLPGVVNELRIKINKKH